MGAWVSITFCFNMACKSHLVPFTSHSKIEHVCTYLYCGTCPRSGPNWRSMRESLGQWRDPPMLPAASTMVRSTLSCWLLEELVMMASL